jgi:hypothetical protein
MRNQMSFDQLMRVGGFKTPDFRGSDQAIMGWGLAALYDEDMELAELGLFTNTITNYGDQFYGHRAAGIASAPAAATGMQLGTSTTAVNKGAGTGLNIQALVAASLVAFDGGFPQSTGVASGTTAYRVVWKTTWAAGVATASAVISRAVLGTTVNKAAGDTLAITWNHDLLGA